jgi:hypothetical protein
MKGSRKVKVLFSVLFVMSIAILSFVHLYFSSQKVVEDLENEIMGVHNLTGVPYIISLPPIVALEGQLYEYYVRVVDRDTELKDLRLEYVSGPNWLELEDMVLKGIPPSGSSGSYKIVLRVSDGYNSSTQEEYILVEEFIEDYE